MHDNQTREEEYVEKRFSASADAIEVKEPDDGRTVVRMPISSTAEDRDGDEFSEEGLENERDQINDGQVPAFLDHGRGSRGSYYGVLGMVGTWDNATIETESYDGGEDEQDSIDVLYADFVPTKANDDAADVVALAEDDMPIGASVGFRIHDYEYLDDEGKFRFHAVDLLETSLVGIPSNPVTVNGGSGGEGRAISAKALGSPQPRERGHRPITHQNLNSVGDAHRQASQELNLGDKVPNEASDLWRHTSSEGAATSEDLAEIRETIEQLDGPTTVVEDPSEVSFSDSALVEMGLDPEEVDDQYRSDIGPDESMGNDTDGGDDPANDDELLEAVREQNESNRELAASIETLADSLGGEKDTAPSDEDEGGEGGSEDKDVDPGRETVALFAGDDADEDVRKEFDRLKEQSNDDGELDLADPETKLFDDSGSDEDADDEKSAGTDAGGDNEAIF